MKLGEVGTGEEGGEGWGVKKSGWLKHLRFETAAEAAGLEGMLVWTCNTSRSRSQGNQC